MGAIELLKICHEQSTSFISAQKTALGAVKIIDN